MAGRGGKRRKPTGRSGVRHGADIVHVGLFDLDGGIRERRLRRGELETEFAKGGTFCNVVNQWDVADSVHGAGPFVGEAVTLDRASERPYPFEPDASFMIADFSGPSAEISSRQVLRRQIDRARALGFRVRASFEFEWLLFEESAQSLRDKDFSGLRAAVPDNRCWDGQSAAIHADLIRCLEEMLRAADIPLFGLGMELGPGCLEATMKAAPGIRAADDALLFKSFTKAFFRRRNLTAAFMAQADAGFPGLSGHIHLSLTDDRGRPLFFAAKAKNHVAPLLENFVAGALGLAPELIALPLHTVNSYRRLSPGNWAPRTPTWSLHNYSTAIRIVADRAETARLEFRLPGADVNPHLGLAMLLGAGLEGIERKLKPPSLVTGDGRVDPPQGTPSLPRDLWEAAEALERSKTARRIFGGAFVDHFAASRRHEFNALRRAVSAAERRRYIESV